MRRHYATVASEDEIRRLQQMPHLDDEDGAADDGSRCLDLPGGLGAGQGSGGQNSASNTATGT
jgi:hypothetical protein